MGLKTYLVWLMMGLANVAIAQPHALQIFDTDNSPIPENNILALAIAPDSTLWIGTENGLATLKNGDWSIIDTLQGYPVRAIAFDNSGYAWVGTFLNGLWVQTDTGWVNHTSANSPLPDDYVRAIAFCPNGDAWLGTVAGAVHISGGNWQVYRQSNTNWFTQHITSAHCTPTNKIWLGGINSGLMHLVDTTWIIYRTLSSGLPDNTILDIQGMDNGGLWLAMPAAGAAVFDGNLGWVYYSTITSNNPSNSINKICIGTDGIVYLASIDKGLVIHRGGLQWFNLSTTARPDTSGAYLPSNHLQTIVQDADGVLWASANNMGLLRIQFLDSTTSVPSINHLATILPYPNPATDYLIIESTLPSLGITLTDLAGKVLLSTTSNSPQTKIPLSNLPKGTFMVILHSGGAHVAHRVVKY